MSAPRTARARARAELTREITDAARRHLAVVGPAALSLRAVARSLDMVPSALYRYFASRDALLTALIIDAYQAVGEAADAADAGRPRDDLTGRWLAMARAIRGWAQAHPHEWGLVYGTPVPGYRAPEATIPAALRVTRALTKVFADAHQLGQLQPVALAVPVPAALAESLRPLQELLLPGAPPEVGPRVVMAWTQVMGAVSLELFGHYEGGVLDPEAMFLHGAACIAALAGLPGAP